VTTIVGRDRKLERVEAFLDGGSHAGCLVLQGEPGLGKATLWRHGVDVARSRGSTTLFSRPLALDTRIPFARLHDLLGGSCTT
jgi:hypothetical protein